MKPIYTDTVQLQAKHDWFYQLTEKIESDKLFYSINYNTTDETKIIFAELTGNGASKLVNINFNTNKGIKTGEFISSTTFTNIYFEVERIRFFSEVDIEFILTVFQKVN